MRRSGSATALLSGGARQSASPSQQASMSRSSHLHLQQQQQQQLLLLQTQQTKQHQQQQQTRHQEQTASLPRPSSAVPTLRSKSESRESRDARESSAGFMTRGSGLRKHPSFARCREHFLLSPAQLDFGQLPAGGPSRTLSLTLQNMDATQARFRVLAPLLKCVSVSIGSTKVAAGMRATIEVTVTPERAGVLSDEIVVQAGEREQYSIPLVAEVVESLGAAPSQEEDPAGLGVLFESVPRLHGSYFDWREQELVFAEPEPVLLDLTLPLDQLRALADERRAAAAQGPLLPFCVRVSEQRRACDDNQDQVSGSELSAKIQRVLDEPTRRRALFEPPPLTNSDFGWPTPIVRAAGPRRRPRPSSP